MTMQTCMISSWPSAWGMPNNANSLEENYVGAITFDAAADKCGFVARASQAMTITDVSIRIANSAATATLECRIETVSNGRPTGTLWSTTTNGTGDITSSSDHSWLTITLTSSASITAGQEYAIVLGSTSGTPNCEIAGTLSGNLLSRSGVYPLVVQDVSGAGWSVNSNNFSLSWIVESSGTPIFIPGLTPQNGLLFVIYNSGSAADEVAARFVVPFKARIIGAEITMCNIAAGANYRVFLWDTGGESNTESNALASTEVIDGDSTMSTSADGIMTLFFTAPYTVAAGSTVYLGVRAETANSVGVVVLRTGTLPTGGLAAFPSGADTYKCTRAWSAINPGTVGAWAEDQTQVPLIRLLFDQLDDGAGAGGGGGIRMAGHGGLAA